MSDEIIAGLMGLVGGLLGSLVGYIATVKQLKSVENQSKRAMLVPLVANLLTEYRAEQAKRDPQIIEAYWHDLESVVKSFHLQGDKEIANSISSVVGAYLSAVEQYASGSIDGRNLLEARVQTRDEVKSIVKEKIG